VTGLAEIFRRYGPAYRAKYGEQMLPSHRRAMADIEQCRTRPLGGHVYLCEKCEKYVYSYHSCQNRHCPQCGHEAAERWLARQQQLRLPVPYFMVTFTLPEELRRLARSHQKTIYNILFRSSAAALQQLARDPRFVGGQIGMVGVLQTWARDMSYHPHVHYLAPGGGVAADGQSWLPGRQDFLVHVRPLSKLFRGKFRAALEKTDLYEQVPESVWHKEWVVHCQAVGSGEAALKYLAPYIFRIALSNRRIVKVENDEVTFWYQDGKTKKRRYLTLPAEEFIRRFLQHTLPKGFVKVRYYGLFSPSYRPLLDQLRLWLPGPPLPVAQETTPAARSVPQCRCPTCGQPMRHIARLEPQRCRPPPTRASASPPNPPTSTGPWPWAQGQLFPVA
jgi:hypothetical protein